MRSVSFTALEVGRVQILLSVVYMAWIFDLRAVETSCNKLSSPRCLLLFVLQDLTYADLAIYYFCDCMKKFRKDCLDGSVLETVLIDVAADARVKKWLEKRPESDF